MNYKTLLLGTAAALMVGGAAQAADLTVAEPVDYVKVCDAFGAGFFYSPGTDTCIKVGGYVKFGTNVNSNGLNTSRFPSGSQPDAGSAHWGSFYTEASLQLTASSVTEYGNLTGWIDLRTRSGSQYNYAASGYSGDRLGHIDSAYLQLGGLKAGHFTSAFDYLGGYTDYGSFRADGTVNHIQYTYAMGNFGLTGSIEDGTNRYWSGQPNFNNTSASPDLVGAISYTTGPISAKLSGAYVQHEVTTDTNGYAIQLGAEIALDNISPGDKFGIQGVYTKDAPYYSGYQKFFQDAVPMFDGNVFGGFVSYQHYWNPSLWSAVETGYLHHDSGDNAASGDIWHVSASTDWAIVKNLDLMLDGSYAKSTGNSMNPEFQPYYANAASSQWSFNVWLKRSW